MGRGRAAQLTREIPELEVGWWWVLVFCTTRTSDLAVLRSGFRLSQQFLDKIWQVRWYVLGTQGPQRAGEALRCAAFHH